MQNTQLTTSHPSKPKRFVIVSLAATAMVLGSQLPASARNLMSGHFRKDGLQVEESIWAEMIEERIVELNQAHHCIDQT